MKRLIGILAAGMLLAGMAWIGYLGEVGVPTPPSPGTPASPLVAPPAPPLLPPVPPADSPVTLDSSFEIPDELAKSLSHLPSVRFSGDGATVMAVTNTGDLIVWETESRKVLKQTHLSDEAIIATDIQPDARQVAWVQENGTLTLLDLRDDTRRTLDLSRRASTIRLSPDGSRLAVAHKTSVEIWSTHGERLNRLDLDSNVNGLAWRPDAQSLAAVTGSGELVMFNSSCMRVTRRISCKTPLYAVAYSPDGTAVAYGGHDRTVYQLRLSRDKPEVISDQQPYWITSIGYSPDGTRLAVGDESCDIWIFRLTDKVQVFHSKHHVECWLQDPAWTPDGEQLVFGCKPNSHAGRPTVYQGNSYAEAVQHGAIQKQDAELKRFRDDLSKVADAEGLGDVARRYCEQQSQGGSGHSVMSGNIMINNQQVQLAFSGWNGSIAAAAPIDPALETKLQGNERVKEVLDRLVEAQKKRDADVQREVKAINSRSLLNCWRVADR